jgi:hypothetical protein
VLTATPDRPAKIRAGDKQSTEGGVRNDNALTAGTVARVWRGVRIHTGEDDRREQRQAARLRAVADIAVGEDPF